MHSIGMDLSSYSPAVSGPDTASLDKAAARRAAGEAYSDKFAQDEKSGVNMKCHNTTTHQVISRRQRLSEGDFQLATLPAYRHSICFQLVPAEFSGTDKLLPTPSQVTLMLGSPPSPRSRHVLTSLNGYLWVFGGQDATGESTCRLSTGARLQLTPARRCRNLFK